MKKFFNKLYKHNYHCTAKEKKEEYNSSFPFLLKDCY